MNGTELIQAIREAFRDVKLEDGVSLNMTEYYDSYETEDHFKLLAEDDERDDWGNIDDKTLEEFTGTFCFTDWKGFRFYLPAYMIWTIHHPWSGSTIGDSTIYALNPDRMLELYERAVDQILDKQQMEAVVLFLQHCVENSDHCDDVAASANLNKMRKYL